MNQNGDEVFAYPGSAWLNDVLFDTPVPFTGRVQGLSIATEILPAVGPVVQFPAGALLPETPAWDWVREILMPFGPPGAAGGFLESQYPAWFQKFRTSGLLRDVPFVGQSSEQARLLNNTALDLLAYEISSGKRERPRSLAELNDAIDDNMDKAKWLYVVRGAAQFGAPTAPAPEHVAADKAGNVLVAQVMRDRLYTLQKRHGPDVAFDLWMEEYGDAAYLVIQPKSQALVYGAPVTDDGAKWERANGDLVKRYPNTYGYFAPTTGDFDFGAYARQFRTGKREALSPEQALMLANNRVASSIYYEQRNAIPRPTEEQRTWLRQLKRALKDEYPGFGMEIPGLGRRTDRDTAIAELSVAANDPKIAETDAGKGLALYLQAREKAVKAGKTAVSFRQAKTLRGTRDWLRQVGEAVVERHPAFLPLWEQIFDAELADDTEEE